MSAQPSAAGIITTQSGEREIPESRRADGTTRKAIKIKPGYQPPEDVAKFRVKALQQATRPRGVPGVPGAPAAIADSSDKGQDSAASNKNAKRREARKKAKATDPALPEKNLQNGSADSPNAAVVPNGTDATDDTNKTDKLVDADVEKEKKARNLRKKLRQARDLETKKEGGVELLPEQMEKVVKISQLIKDLEVLGFGDDNEKGNTSKTPSDPPV